MISTTSLSAGSLVVLSIALFHLLVPLHVFAEEWVTSREQSLKPRISGEKGGATTIMLNGTDGQTNHVDFYFDFADPENCLENTMTCICLEMIPGEDGKVGNGETRGVCPDMISWCINWPNGTADWLHLTDSVLLRKQLTIAVDGAGSTGTSQLGLKFPANMTLFFGKEVDTSTRGRTRFETLLCDTVTSTTTTPRFSNGLEKNKVNITTIGASKYFALKAAGSNNCPFTVQLKSKNAFVVVPRTTTPAIYQPNTTLAPDVAGPLSVGKAGFGFPWWAILVAGAVLLFILVTVLYFLLVHLMWKRRCCFKNMDRRASTGSVSPDKPSDPKNKAAQSADAQAKKTQSKEAQPKDGNDKRAPAGHDGSKPQPMARQQEDAVTRQQEGAVTRQQDDLADVDFDYINIGNVIDPESTSQSQRNTVRAKDDPLKRTHVEPSKEEPKMLQPIIAPEPSELTFSQALFNGQMSELRPTFFKAFIAATVVYVILVLLILAGWAVAFIMFPDYLGLSWNPVR